MNPFNQQLLNAQKRHLQRYIQIMALFAIVTLIVLVAIFASRGTRIAVYPNDATNLAAVRLEQGIAIIVGETLYSLSKKPTIAVSAEGFKSVIHRLGPSDFGKVIAVTLEPLPAKIALSTNINDDKTSWLIDGNVIAIAAAFEYELDAGSYELTVIHPHYQDASLALSLARNEAFKQRVPLDPLHAILSVTTSPSGAHITIDDVAKGVSPVDIAMEGGIHNVVITLNNHQTINDSIAISRTTTAVARDYKLLLESVAIAVSLDPQGGQLVLDDSVINNTDNISVTKETNHHLSYSKPGYFTQNKDITLHTNEKVNVAFELQKKMGEVEITSTPQSSIELNGKPIGNTPMQLSLQAVEQKITLRKPGFRSITKLITPSVATPKKIALALLSEKNARLNEAPKTYAHKAGGQLKLFTPNDTFTIGAHRAEQGQRANEFLRKIKLAKAFYAGISEVTNEQYRQYNKDTKGALKEPVTAISWIEAAGFCNWLSQLEGLDPVYQINKQQLIGVNPDSDGYRLLTEAEWEWLARKAGKTTQSRFVWGDKSVIPKNAANIADESANGSAAIFVPKYNDGFQKVAPVKSFTREKSGLYDQGGNVSEWTHDSYSIIPPKSGKVFNDPFDLIDLTKSNLRVVKGASWRSGSITKLRPSFKEGAIKPRDDLGFRIGRYVYGGS